MSLSYTCETAQRQGGAHDKERLDLHDKELKGPTTMDLSRNPKDQRRRNSIRLQLPRYPQSRALVDVQPFSMSQSLTWLQ